MVKISKEAALAYHENNRPGKIEVKPTKPYHTQTDLSLAYSPGVAYPCLEIQQNPDSVYKYTDKGNCENHGTTLIQWFSVFTVDHCRAVTDRELPVRGCLSYKVNLLNQ